MLVTVASFLIKIITALMIALIKIESNASER